MTTTQLAEKRLFNQKLISTEFDSPGEVVKWMVALQAQDYAGSLWSIGMRMNNSTEATIEKAVEEKIIVRTWPMRGTLHFVSATDIRWLLKLLAILTIKKYAGIYKRSELDEQVLSKSRRLFTKALEGGKQLTRPEAYQILEDNKIPTINQRGLHIIGYMAQEGLICFGPRRGKQHTFVLLDEWLPAAENMHEEEAKAKLALRYFTSHGPATQKDFMWWTGFSSTDARKCIELAKSQMVHEQVGDQLYWMGINESSVSIKSPAAMLLPGFDEYLLGYTDRSAAVDDYAKKVVMGSKNGVFSPTIVIDGKVRGIWKRTVKKQKIEIGTSFFDKPSDKENDAVEICKQKLATFLGVELANI